MPTIIACPNCHQDVSLPSRVEGALICPHCDGEFSFAANSAVTESSNRSDAPFAPSTVEVSPDSVAEPEGRVPQAHSAGRETDSPRTTKPSAFHDADFSHVPRESSERVIDEFPEEEPVAERFAPDSPLDDNPADEPNAEFVANPDLEIRTNSSDNGNSRSRAIATRTRRGRNPLGQLLGVIGGGVLGLAIGYYLLNYFGGPQFNFLNLQLPGIPPQPVQPEDSETPGDSNQARADGGRNEQVRRSNQRDSNGQDKNARDSNATAPSVFTPPVLSVADLRSALAAASRSIGCERCEGTGTVTQRVFGGANTGNRVNAPCPECQGDPFSHVTPAGYLALCELARTVTWVDNKDPSARGSEEALRMFLLQTANTPEQRAHLSAFAASRLLPETSTDAAQNGDGILLVGKIVERRQEGALYLTVLDLPSSDSTSSQSAVGKIVVASAAQAPGLLGESLLVAGAVLHNPRSSLPNYQGQESLVVWGGFPLVVR